MTRNIAVQISALFVAVAAFAGAARADESASVVRNGTIGYVLTDYHWALYQTKDSKAECPQGFNDGPREQFKILFPADDGKQRTLLETQLARESAIWHPDLSPEQFAFKEATGKYAIGLNLDGKVGPNDFSSPDGDVKGVDNQLYRVLGCVSNYRGPDGTLYHFNNKFMQQHEYARVLIELSGVDSLVNDNDVTITTYRGRDGLLTDATGNSFMPGGTQRADHRWGKEFIARFKGKIVDGVLTAQATDYYVPTTWAFEDVTDQWFRDPRFQLKITQDRAEGLLGGYVDIETFYRQMVRSVSTHHESYGQQSAPSVYRALHKLADAYPDKDGHNTAISAAMDVKFTQVFIEHPPRETATKDADVPARAARH
jgi:hypothetical protein